MKTELVVSTTLIVDQSSFGPTEPNEEFLSALSRLIEGFCEDFGNDMLAASFDAEHSKLYLVFRNKETATYVERTFMSVWKTSFGHLDMPF